MPTSAEIENRAFFQPLVQTIRLALDLPVAIWLADDQGESLRIVAAEDLPDDYMHEVTLDLDEPSVGSTVFKTGETIVVPDVASDERWQYKAQAADIGLKSAMVVPLRAGQEMRGILDVYTYEARDFTDLEKKLIEEFASKVVSDAIPSARYFQKKSTQADILKRIHQIGRRILSAEFSTKGLKAALTQIAKSAKDALGADLVDIYQYLDVEDLEMRDRYVLPPISVGQRQDPTIIKEKIYEDDVIVKVIKDGEPLYACDAQAQSLLTDPFTVPRPDRPENRFVLREGVLSSTAIPLKTAGETVGVMFVNYRKHQDFPPVQQELIELFANQAAMAIHNARIYEQARKRIGALEALHRVGQKLSSMEVTEQGLSELLEEVVEQAKEILDADLVELYQYSPRRKQATHVRAGERLEAAGPKIERVQILSDDVVAKIITDPVPVFISDARNMPLLSEPFKSDRVGKPRDRFVVREQIASLATLPLSVDGEPVGVLFVNFRTPQPFTDEQKVVIRLFAGQAAVAIRNARLFQQRETLQEIAHDITSELDSDKLLQSTLVRSLKLLNCDFGSISVYDPKSQLLHFRYTVGKSVDRYRSMGEGLIGLAAQKRTTIRVVDVSKDNRYLEHNKETKSELDVPMLIGKRLVGVLNAESSRLNAFSKEDQRLAETLASQAAVAFHTAELIKRHQVLTNFSQKINSEIRLKEREILNLIYEQASALMDTDNMYIALYEPDPNEPDKYNPADGAQSEIYGTVRFPLAFEDGKPLEIETRKAGKGRTEHIIRTKRSLFHPTAKEGRIWYSEADHQEYLGQVSGSWIGVPMIVGRKVLGVIATYNPKRDHVYGEDDLDILEVMANQAAVALDNAELYYDINQRLQSLVDVGQLMTSSIRRSEENIVTTIYDQASNLMDVNNMYIALYDDLTDTVRFPLAFEEGQPLNVETRKGGRGRTEYIIQTRKPLFHPTAEDSAKWYLEPGHEDYVGMYFASWLGVPMIAGDQILGVIATYHPNRDYVYGPEDLKILRAMADQAAVALDNARAFERLETLVKFMRAITSGTRLNRQQVLSEKQIIDLVYTEISRLMDASNMAIALCDAHKDRIRFPLVVQSGQRQDSWEPRPGLSGQGKTNEILRTKQPILLTTKVEEEEWYAERGDRARYLDQPRSSYLGVPMLVGERVIGVIDLYSLEDEYQYDGNDLQTLVPLANQAAVALDNARLYRETQELQEQISATEQIATLGTAIAALQHRINNTFNIIVPNVTRLRKRVDLEDETIVEILDIIERNARYTSDIIGRIQEPLREVEVQDVNINAVLEEVMRIVAQQWPGITVKSQLDDDIPLIRASSGQVTEVFRNLSENACHAMNGEGELRVVSQLDNTMIKVSIRDTGPGIPPAIQERLFKKPVPSKEPGGGAGLGLWLSELILQTIGGTVEIEESGAQGTTMLVQIPVTEGGGARP